MDFTVLREIAKKHNDKILHPYNIMVETDGFNAVCVFAAHYSGSSVYIPSIRTIFSKCIEEDIKLQKNTKYSDIRGMAKKYGYSDSYIRGIFKNG